MTSPSAGGELFDLVAAAEAAATEAGAQPFAFTYKDETYEIPPGREWPVAALSALAAGELESALSALLGPANYLQLTDAGLTIGELNALFAAVGKQAGFPSLPNSSPPARPGSTRRPKRR